MTEQALGDYEELASEYYSSIRHPTCANFRSASAIVLDRWRRTISRTSGWICEVGSGRSLLAEFLAAGGEDLHRLILIDSSRSMLRHSTPWMHEGARLVVGDARALPVRSESLALLVAAVGDPYNEPALWAEVSRILRPRGVVVFTTPSYAWASSFRPYSNGRKTAADFELADGRHVSVPSLIYPDEQQAEMIATQGLRLKEVYHVPISALKNQPISPKLRVDHDERAEVLTGYLAVKR